MALSFRGNLRQVKLGRQALSLRKDLILQIEPSLGPARLILRDGR